MNVIGFTLALMATILIHVLLKRFMEMQKDQKDLIEQYRNKLAGRPLNYKAIERENQQKYIDFKDYDYKGPNFSLIEDDEGYDIDNDYDLFKEDLMKYVEGANDYFNVEQHATGIANEQTNIVSNHNAVSQPMDKKEFNFPSKKGGVSLDRQYNNSFEANNKKRNSQLPYKTLKPDQWTYNNEKTINGGFFDEKSGLMSFDAAEEMNMVLL